MNALISIRNFRIIISDLGLGKKSRNIVGSEMVFCTEYVLVMYPKKALRMKSDQDMKRPENKQPKIKTDDDLSSDSSFEKELFDIEKTHF